MFRLTLEEKQLRTGSRVVREYCDVNVRRRFETPGYSFDDFNQIDPKILHDLNDLKPVERRASCLSKHGANCLIEYGVSIKLGGLNPSMTETFLRR